VRRIRNRRRGPRRGEKTNSPNLILEMVGAFPALGRRRSKKTVQARIEFAHLRVLKDGMGRPGSCRYSRFIKRLSRLRHRPGSRFSPARISITKPGNSACSARVRNPCCSRSTHLRLFLPNSFRDEQPPEKPSRLSRSALCRWGFKGWASTADWRLADRLGWLQGGLSGRVCFWYPSQI